MTFLPSEIYDRISRAVSRLQDDGDVFRRFIEKMKLERLEFWLLTRFRYFPGSVTAKDFATFGPYTSISKYRAALGALVDKQLAESVGDTRYRLSDSGRKSVEDTYQKHYGRVARVSALSDEETARLHELVDRVYVQALRQVDVPVPILSAVHSTMPEIESVWVQIERRAVGLQVMRDDAHIAAWREAGYTGPRIEVSTALYHSANSLSHAELREAASRLDDDDFLGALSALHAGGEVAQHDARYTLSKSGRAVRQSIEDATNASYAAPFEALANNGHGQIEQLMVLMEKVATHTG
jgi:hypothetical protein